jgi:N-acylglucosamine-6-phosphate 2-epimerase
MNEQDASRLPHGLVVSCQAYPGEPMQVASIMSAIAQAAVLGGAVGIRAQGLADIHAVREAVSVPVIGLVKVGKEGVFITPTVAACVDVAAAGADIVALDGTTRPRPDGSSVRDCVEAIHQHGRLVLADCGSAEDAEHSLAAGADFVATTLAGHTPARPKTNGPDFELLEMLIALADVPVIAEGGVRTPAEAVRCLELGAHAVVVGTAITHPTSITRSFVQEMARKSPR